MGSQINLGIGAKGQRYVLDLGCGDGANTALISEALPNGEVIGIDASKGMIDTAKPKEKNNLRFILMDIDEIAFEDEFDVVYSNATLHWIKDHHRLLKKVFNALRNGGLLRFNFAADRNCSHLFKVIRKAMEKEEFSRFFSDTIGILESKSRFSGCPSRINSWESFTARVWPKNSTWKVP